MAELSFEWIISKCTKYTGKQYFDLGLRLMTGLIRLSGRNQLEKVKTSDKEIFQDSFCYQNEQKSKTAAKEEKSKDLFLSGEAEHGSPSHQSRNRDRVSCRRAHVTYLTTEEETLLP